MKFTRFLMLFSLSVTTLLLLVIGTLLYAKTGNFLDGRLEQIVGIKLNQTAVDTKKEFEDVYQIVEKLRENADFQSATDRLADPRTSSYEQVTLSKNIDYTLFNLKRDNEFIDRIAFLAHGSQYSSNKPFFSYSLDEGLTRAFASIEQTRFIPPGGTYRALAVDRSAIGNPKLLADLDKLNRSVYFISDIRGRAADGIVIFTIDMARLSQLIPHADTIAVVGADKELLFQGERADKAAAILEQLSAGGMAEGEQVRGKDYYYQDIGLFGLRLLFIVERRDYEPQLGVIGLSAVSILLGCMFLSLVATRLIGRRILWPMHKLVRRMNRYGQDGDAAAEADGNDMKPTRRRMTMRDRLFVYFMITIMLPILLFVFLFYFQSNGIVSRNLQQTYYTAFQKTAHRLDLFIKQKETELSRVAFDSNVLEYLLRPSAAGAQVFDRIAAENHYRIMTQDAFAVYDVDNRLLYANRPHMDDLAQPFYDEMRLTRQRLYSYPHADSGSAEISLGKAIFDLKNFGEPLGFIKADINEILVSNLYSELRADGSTVFIDDGGRVVSHAEQTRIGEVERLPAPLGELDGYLSTEDSVLYFTEQIANLPWHLVSKYDYSVVRKQAEDLIYNDIYLLIIIFLLALLFAYYMSQYLVRPLSAMQARFPHPREEDAGSFAAEPDSKYAIDEVDQLQQSFDRMLQRIEQLADEKLDAERRQMLLQIDTLQAQINPHFLHNTIESIIYLIETDERRRAVDMISLLSRHLRYAMGKENPMTTMREEIASAKIYLNIMGVRYDNRISCNWTVDEATLDGATVKMILQPIIENAILHSLSVKERKVSIEISCLRSGDETLLTVSDNGAGMTERKLRQLRGQLHKGGRGSVGMHNVHSRIRLHFGAAYGLTVDSAPGAGTTVVMRMPCLIEPGENADHRVKE